MKSGMTEARIVERRRDLGVLAAQIAIVYKLPIAECDSIVEAVAGQTVGRHVEIDQSHPARQALLAPYRRPDGSTVIE